MNILKQLNKKHEAPGWAVTLKQFKRRPVAKLMGVSTGYMCNVIAGSKEPSKKLEEKLKNLAKRVEIEI